MSKTFIFILCALTLFSVIFYQFSFAEKNEIISVVCRDTVSSFCRINMCGGCQYLRVKDNILDCDLGINPNNYFNRGGSCSFTERSQCEWEKTRRTGICAQIRSIDSNIKLKLKIDRIAVYGLNYIYAKP